MTSSLYRPMTKEESYVQRRQLFKSIWDTALNISDKEDILTKPKVIKTLRMDEIDKCPIGTSKKQRIKNLRHVCNRILDFCNRQEADDRFYERLAAKGGVSKTNEDGSPKTEPQKPKRIKVRVKRKYRKVKSMVIPNFMPNDVIVGNMKLHEVKSSGGNLEGNESSESVHSIRKRRVKTVKRKVHRRKTQNAGITSADTSNEETVTKRRVHKNKPTGHGKKVQKKKTIKTTSPQIISV